MKQLEGTYMLKANTSAWQNGSLLLLQSNSFLSNFFVWCVAILCALPQRVWLCLQPPVGQPSHPQTEEIPPPGPRDLGGPLRDNSCCPGAAAWWKPGRLIPFSWGSEQRGWHPFRKGGKWERRAHTAQGSQQNNWWCKQTEWVSPQDNQAWRLGRW